MIINNLKHLTCVCLFLISQQLNAQDGQLDISFGDNGLVRTDVNNLFDVFKAIEVQPDGKIVVVGHTSTASTANKESLIVRYNPDGSLDTSFGANGFIIAGFTTGFDTLNAVALQSDGKIVVGGYAGLDFVLARYMPNGQQDFSFGNNGIVFTNFHETIVGSTQDRINCIAIQDDGKIFVGGYAKYFSNYPYAIIKYNADGTVDESFGINGRTLVNHDFGIATGYNEINDILLTEDGKIYAVGEQGEFSSASYNNQTITRFNSDGSIDEDFAINGKRYFDLNRNSLFIDIEEQEDGKLVILGNDGVTVTLVRLNENAEPDSAFSENGRVTPTLSSLGATASFAKSVSIQQDGKIMISCNANGTDGAQSVVLRYLQNGVLDSNFSNSGIFNYLVGDGYQGGSFSALQSNNLIVGGDYNDSSTTTTDLYLFRISSPSLSTDNFLDSKIEIFPNPVFDNLYITTNGLANDLKFRLYSINGKEIKINSTSFPSDNLIEMNVSHLARGTYLMVIDTNALNTVKKIIKN
jgi:uncharacterized delta-60 repeat protein